MKRAAGRAVDSMKQSYQSGARGAMDVTGGSSTAGTIGGEATEPSSEPAASAAAPNSGGPPDWARKMQRSQKMSHGVQTAGHAVKSGDAHGGGSSVNLDQGD